MRRLSRSDVPLPFLDDLLAVGDGAPDLDRKAELLGLARGAGAEVAARFDRVLLERLDRQTRGLVAAQAAQEELRALLARLEAPPWHPAILLRLEPTPLGVRAMVLHQGARRLVALADDVDAAALVRGEEVYLGSEGSVVAARSPYGVPRCGETAWFERATADGRCVLRWRDDEVVVDVAGTLDLAALEPGDQVRWDRTAWMAFERVGGGSARRFLADEIPDVGRDAVGGQSAALDLLVATLTATLVAPEKARRYRLDGRRSVLLHGAAGCGKTLMARVAAAEVRRRSARPCRFAVVKPGEWEAPFVGETQMNIRRTFEELRRTDDLTVLFLDEVEAIGRIRGGAATPHADKFLAALLAELDGFVARRNLAVIAATNRKDLIDPALLERLSDVEIAVARPDLDAARAIFAIHLPPDLPFGADGRDAVVETAVSRLYSPNGDNAVATLVLRDGRRRSVAARELMSGRAIAQVCAAARQRAFLRDEHGGDAGIGVADVEDAIADALERLATTLTPRNAHAHLSDLPADVDVAGVEPVVRRVSRPHRYRHAA